LLNDDRSDVRSSAVSAFAKLADHGKFVIACYPDIANADIEVGFRKEIGTAIPRLIALLNDGHPDVQSSTVSALVRLVDHG
jgi:HEAT repeat protein